jgi:hypothetical protein
LTPGGSSIHLHTNRIQNTEDETHIKITRKKITITRKKLGSKLGIAGRAPSLRERIETDSVSKTSPDMKALTLLLSSKDLLSVYAVTNSQRAH